LFVGRFPLGQRLCEFLFGDIYHEINVFEALGHDSVRACTSGLETHVNRVLRRMCNRVSAKLYFGVLYQTESKKISQSVVFSVEGVGCAGVVADFLG
jgi:hypothetical protein